MIGLDSYSRQVFYLFGPHFNLYQSLNRLPIWNSQNCSMFPLAFVAGWLQGHWWGFISRNYVVWPTSFLWMFSLLLKDLISDFYLSWRDSTNQFVISRSGELIDYSELWSFEVTKSVLIYHKACLFCDITKSDNLYHNLLTKSQIQLCDLIFKSVVNWHT